MPAHPWLATSPMLLLKAAGDVPPLDAWLRKHTHPVLKTGRVSLAAVKKHHTQSFTIATQEFFEGGGGTIEQRTEYPDGSTRTVRIAEWQSLALQKGPAMHVDRPASLVGAVYWLIPCSPTESSSR
jgi:hypothetical protein